MIMDVTVTLKSILIALWQFCLTLLNKENIGSKLSF